MASAAALLAGSPVPGLVAGAGWPPPDTLDALTMDLATGDQSRTGWFIILRSSGEVIGDCGWRGGPDSAGEAEIGYGLAAPWRGRGYATEAIGGLLQWGTGQPGVRRLVAEVVAGNEPSRRLLTRLGFEPAGTGGAYQRYAFQRCASPIQAAGPADDLATPDRKPPARGT